MRKCWPGRAAARRAARPRMLCCAMESTESGNQKMKDLFSLEGRVALVTGGSRGIGKMIAKGFIAQGARVYISSRKADVCEQTAAELSQDGGTCVALPVDVSTNEGVAGLANAYLGSERT